MSKFDVCGLGNAVVDIFLELDEPQFEQLGFERGTMTLVEKDEQQSLLTNFHESEQTLQLVSGGSVANSIIAATQLGGSASFIGCVGDDRYGQHYADERLQGAERVLYGGVLVVLVVDVRRRREGTRGS